MSYLIFIYQAPSTSLHTVFDAISSNTDEVLSINPSSNVFVFGDFNIHHREWLTYSGRTDTPGIFVVNFLGSLTVALTVLLFWNLSFDASICSTIVLPPLGYSDHVVVSVFIVFPSYLKQDALFYCIAHDYSCGRWDSLYDHLRDVSWEDILKIVASAADSEFCE